MKIRGVAGGCWKEKKKKRGGGELGWPPGLAGRETVKNRGSFKVGASSGTKSGKKRLLKQKKKLAFCHRVPSLVWGKKGGTVWNLFVDLEGKEGRRKT